LIGESIRGLLCKLLSLEVMKRFVFKVIICLLLATAASVTYQALKSGDPIYAFQEWISPARFHQYDSMIRSVALAHRLDPMLVKAVVWRESRFDAHKAGTAGERGLMQVSARASQEWARENRVENFQPEQLFDPKINLEAGSWYLSRAIQHWEKQSDPIPFALAEYNAGASRAQRWAGSEGAVIPPKTFKSKIDFPGTRKYVDSIIARFEFYKRRGTM
jgi:soluble lytic murein transglycosylase